MPIQASQLVALVQVVGAEESERKLESVGRKSEETGGHFGEMLKHGLEMAGIFKAFELAGEGVDFLKEQLMDTVKVAMAHEGIEAQTVQALKSTRDVSGQTTKSIGDLADAFSRTTLFSADAVQGAENLELTFTNISRSVFPQTTQAILDVSQAMGQDLKESTIQVGKALDDPIKGIGALTRIGVTFSEQEKEQIKVMMAHHNVIGAQKIILHELATEFGGSATAAGKTFGGQLAIMGHQFEDLKIKIGDVLLPVLGDMLTKYVIPLEGKFSDWMTKGGGLQDFQSLVKNISNFFVTDFLPDFDLLLNKFIIPLGTETYNLFFKSGLLQNVWHEINGVFQDVVPVLGTIVTDVGQFVGWLQSGNPLASAFKDILFGIGGAVAAVKISNMVADMVQLGLKTVDYVQNIGPNLVKLLGWDGIAGKATDAGTAVRGIGTSAQIAEGEVAGASVGMEGEISAVEATTATETGAMGLSFSSMLGPIGLVTGAIGLIITQLPGMATALQGTVSQMENEGQVFQDNFQQHMRNVHDNIISGFLDAAQKANASLNGIGADQAANSRWESWYNNYIDMTGSPPPIPTANLGPSHGVTSGLPGHAAGGVSAGGWNMLNEMGPEGVQFPPGAGSPAYLPPGTQVIPNNVMNSFGSGPTHITVELSLDGYLLTRQQMPYIVDILRQHLGTVGM